MDQSIEQIGVGGALFLAALGLLLKYKPWNGHKKTESSGEKSTDFWIREIENLVESGVRKAMHGRNEEIRRIVREEVVKLIESRQRR